MNRLLRKIDDLAGFEESQSVRLWLERLAFVFLTVMIVAAPHSIAATQTAWVLGMIFWIAGFFLKPRRNFYKTALFIPLWLFFGWAVITSLVSYAPDISIDRLRNDLLFLIFFFVVNNLRTAKSVKFVAVALIFSCMVSVIWTPIERIIGRGVNIETVSVDEPYTKAGFTAGDILFQVNNKSVDNPDEIVDEIERNGKAEVRFFRQDFFAEREIKTDDLVKGNTGAEKLGIGSWKIGRNWRSSGFYGHFATYAEVLQLIGSLAFGLMIASFGIPLRRHKREKEERGQNGGENTPGSDRRNIWSPVIILSVCVVLIAFALLLTLTRAPQAALMVSAFSIACFGVSRKWFALVIMVGIPVAIGAAIFLQQYRNVGFIDPKDDSTKWRQTVYREGFELWTKNPRNFTVGVGMDSIKRFAKEWHLFDDGRLPTGHFHSTPLQLLVERGFPALILWLWIMGGYLSRLIKALRADEFGDWMTRGIVLGCFGGAIGFFTSGLFHYNLGDGEVAMIFFMLMAIAVRVTATGDRTPTEIGDKRVPGKQALGQ